VLSDLWYEAELSGFASTHHRVAFAGAGLTIGEHADVVALERMLQHLDANVFIDATLRRVPRVTRLTTATHTRQLSLLPSAASLRREGLVWLNGRIT